MLKVMSYNVSESVRVYEHCVCMNDCVNMCESMGVCLKLFMYTL